MTKKETERKLALLQAEFDEFKSVENGVTIGHLCLVDTILEKLSDSIAEVDFQAKNCEVPPSKKQLDLSWKSQTCLRSIADDLLRHVNNCELSIVGVLRKRGLAVPLPTFND